MLWGVIGTVQEWRAFIESLAGQQIIMLLMIIVGVAILDPSNRQEAGKMIITFALGVMSRSMQTTFPDKEAVKP